MEIAIIASLSTLLGVLISKAIWSNYSSLVRPIKGFFYKGKHREQKESLFSTRTKTLKIDENNPPKVLTLRPEFEDNEYVYHCHGEKVRGGDTVLWFENPETGGTELYCQEHISVERSTSRG